MNRILMSMQVSGILSFAVACCWAVEPSPEQARLVAEIRRLGGSVLIGEAVPGKLNFSVCLDGTQVRRCKTINYRIQALLFGWIS